MTFFFTYDVEFLHLAYVAVVTFVTVFTFKVPTRGDYDQTGRMQFCCFCHDAAQIVSTQSNKQCATATLFCYLSRTYRVLSREYIVLNILTTALAELISIHIQAASVAEWLRPRIFSGLNHTFCRKGQFSRLYWEKNSVFRVVKISRALKRGSFSENTAKRVIFTEIWNTLFRVLSSILCSSIGVKQTSGPYHEYEAMKNQLYPSDS